MAVVATTRNREADLLRQRLQRVRRRMRLIVAVRGLSWVLALVLFGLVCACVLDWRLHTPSLMRALLLVLGVAATATLAYSYLLRPLLARLDDLTLALQIEERYPSLNDSLASTVQFLAHEAPPGQSPGMLQEAIRRALSRANGVDFNRIIDRRGLNTAVLAALTALLIALPLLAFFPGLASIALARLADPFGAHHWTTLELDQPRLRIGRNEGYEVTGMVRGIIPERAVVVYRVDGAAPVEHSAPLTPSEDHASAQLSVRFRAGQMLRDFSFQVRANDWESAWYRVQVLPPPVLVHLHGRPSPQVRLDYPLYTDRSSQWLPDGNGNVDVTLGTFVYLRAAVDRPLRAAWIEFRPEPELVRTAALLTPLQAQSPLGGYALSTISQLIAGRTPATLAEDRQSFHVRFQPLVRGNYEICFEDETGLYNNRLYEMLLQLDPRPSVTLDRPSPQKESLEVRPEATLPLEVLAEDSVFGLRAVWLEYRFDGEPRFRRWPLFDPERSVAQLVLAPLTWPGANAGLVRLREQRLAVSRPLPVFQFRHEDGRALSEGDVITLRACADDFDNVTPEKAPGRSNEIEIRIVSQSALELALNQDQARVQQDLQELRNQEREAIKSVMEVENRLARTGKLTPQDLAQLTRAQQQQLQIRERIEGRDQENLRTRVERILDTLRQNQLRRSAVQERMELVRQELNRLSREELEQIEGRLTTARKQGELPEEGRGQRQPEALDRAADRAEQQARQLEEQARDLGEKEAAQLTAQARELQEQAKSLRELARSVRPDATPQEVKKQRRELELLAEQQEKGARQLQDLARKQTGRERELARQADELKASAETLRQQAQPTEGSTPQDIKPNLTEARRRQEEVEKTLGELLQRMEPWSSSREIKAEARSLQEEQRRLLEEVETMKQQGFLGKEREELKPEQKAQLDTATAAQRKLRERMSQMLDKMKRIANDRRESDPRTAAELDQAQRQGIESDITGKMRTAREELENNRLGSATEQQRASLDELDKLVKQLEDRREAELDRLQRKLRETEKAIQELADQQERLQKKAQEAAQLKDPKKREEELKRLAREQQQLLEQTQEMAKQLSRLRNERASESLRQAAAQMEQAVRNLERGEPSPEQQAEALDRLDEGQEDVEKARAEAEEELAREQLVRVADVLKRLKERHERLIAERERIHKQVLQQKAWSRGLLISLGDLSRAQEGLAQESRSVAERDLTSTLVVARMLRRAADAMERASKRFLAEREQIQDHPESTEPDQQAVEAQSEALRRLQQMLDAIKQEAEASSRPAGGRQPGGASGRSGPENPGIPPLAQLKLLRNMQLEINKRTQQFLEKNPERENWTPAQKAELDAIQREQREVADLIEELTQGSMGGEDR